MRVHLVVGALVLGAAFACGTSSDPALTDGADSGTGNGGADASTTTGSSTDAGQKQSGNDAGQQQQGTDAGNGADSGNSGDAGTITDSGTSADAGNGCIKGVVAPANGHHNPGDDCLSCHNGAGSAPKWTVAGTLYNDATGTAPVGGATIEVIDKNGQKLDLVSNTNGNFYIQLPVVFPLTVRASDCPSNDVMTASVSDGSCNSCHNSTMRIHLP